MLNATNKAILNEMKLYVHSSSVVPGKADEILSELEDHLLIAQGEGKTFEEIFGRDVKAYCDELIAELPKQSWPELLKSFAPVFPLLLLWRFLNGFTGELTIALYENIAYLILSAVLVAALIVFLRKSAFLSKSRSFGMMLALSFGMLLVYIVFFLVSGRLLPAEPQLSLTGGAAYIAAAISLIIILYYLFAPIWQSRKR